MTGADFPAWLEQFRETELAALDGLVYLDNALRGPCPSSAVQAAQAVLEASRRGRLGRRSEHEGLGTARRGLAKLLGWPEGSVAFTTNTTTALGLLAQSLPWRAGDVVLTTASEVPSTTLPFQALAPRGVELHAVSTPSGLLDQAEVAEALAGGARALVLAAVALDTGERRDLAALARLTREAGAWLLVDAAQAVGCLQVDFSQVDAVAGSGRKWLQGPPDVGFLAVRPDFPAPLVPPTAGGLSFRAAQPAGVPALPLIAMTQDPDGARPGVGPFEGGVLPGSLLAGLAQAIDLHVRTGPERVEARVLARVADVHAQASARGLPVLSPALDSAACSGIVWVQLPSAPPDLERRLEANGVVVRVQGDRLRISPHWWNTPEDVERAFLALDATLGPR
jgi:selenocysteine lyase/cysteine desulfurase